MRRFGLQKEINWPFNQNTFTVVIRCQLSMSASSACLHHPWGSLVEDCTVRIFGRNVFFVLATCSVCSNGLPPSKISHSLYLCLFGIMKIVIQSMQQKRFPHPKWSYNLSICLHSASGRKENCRMHRHLEKSIVYCAFVLLKFVDMCAI